VNLVNCGLPVRKIWALIGLVTFNFDLLSSKWGHGLPCHGLPANFQFPTPFRSVLSVRHGKDRRTDRQTDDGQQCIMPPPYEGADIINIQLEFGMYPQSMPTEWTHARTVRPWQSVRLDL